MAIVETENLTKYYGKSRGILEVTLSIQEGEFFGFIGPNGAGKSTTIRTLMSLLHPSSGRAEIFGLDCRTQGPRIRKQVGYLPAEANYYDDMRVGAFFEYAMRFYPGSSRERLDMLCERLDVDRTKRIGALSTGNKKKLAVVQALLHEPRLLILDEPTTGLDPLVQNRLYELLREENARGVTVFLSSHVLSEVQKLCDRVAIIKEGRILRTETIEHLRGSLYKEIRVEFTRAEDAEAFDPPDSAAVRREDRQVSFLYSGRADDLLRLLVRYGIENLWMDEPDLEKVFLHFYEKESE